jgi:hypothetical protein
MGLPHFSADHLAALSVTDVQPENEQAAEDHHDRDKDD